MDTNKPTAALLQTKQYFEMLDGLRGIAAKCSAAHPEKEVSAMDERIGSILFFKYSVRCYSYDRPDLG